MEDLMDLQISFEHGGLLGISGDPVEDQNIDIGFIKVHIDPRLQLREPEFNRQFIRNQFASTGIVHKALPESGAGIERAKDIATGKMKKAGNRP